ncbi:protein-tyrosine sulfotransferase-like isoform X2 [Chenopodium quinoa]|uniref:protein-tyrosine sulfotransferase-like isoform X2 n=1 Tax=Chenopodium quinoa TaxID=63459 RepID=UPI000B76C9E7|nr:protein-tyrosine sulfotransferase-like isoform X2 [Chenopodium quinoa]
MDFNLKWIVPLLIIGSVFMLVNASSDEVDYQHCEIAVNNWAASQLSQEVKEDKHALRDLLFFLHIPRTGGRTYFHCFLKKLYSSKLECPRSYDKLRFNPRKAHCRLLVTHDDYSMMTKLPQDKTSVVTILRNPVDRVFSTYEFSIEVAARFLVHPNLTSAIQMAGRLRKKNNVVSTLDIWPWKYLVPWMREDLFARRDARLSQNLNHVSKDSYNMEDFAMPLLQYINDPIALDIVHNGATFQVAGLTNNSNLAESHEVRTCVQKYHSLGDSVLDVAKRRLDNMLYVGLTEDHKGSATTFAHVVGAQVISQLVGSNFSMDHQANNITEQSYSHAASESQHGQHTSISVDESPSNIPNADGEFRKSEMTVGKLMGTYQSCIGNLRKSQSQRRITSLKKISPVNYTKEARHQVPESVIEQIISLNRLDMELYKYAQKLFARQHEQTVQKLLQERQNSILMNSFTAPPWENISLIMAVVLVIVAISIIVNARRRMSKVKI